MKRPLRDSIRDWVAAHPTSKIPLDAVLQQATTVDPSLHGDPASRARIAAALTELAETGYLVLPKTRSGWDSRTQPPLPIWVAKPAIVKAPRVERPSRVWPRQLEAAAAIAVRDDEYKLLDAIASWLRDNPAAESVPIEERSIEVFGDEKTLSIETTKRLFTSGALTLDALACHSTPFPFPSQHVHGTGPTRLLVAENTATYHSLLTFARSLDPATRPDIHIGWGIGNQFPVSVASVALLEPQPVKIFYFGDLDVAGLRMAANAASTAGAKQLPALEPAAALYRWVLKHGSPRPDRSNKGADSTVLVRWLPEDIRQPVTSLLSTKQRIAQETLGLRALRANPTLLVQAVAVDLTAGT